MTVLQDNIRVSSAIFQQLAKNPTGEVLLSTSKGVYLHLSSKIFLITGKDYGIFPLGIGVSSFVDFVTELKPKTGDPVRVDNQKICFPGGVLECTWELCEPQKRTYNILPQRVDQCAKQLIAQCNERSLAPLACNLILDQPLPKRMESDPYGKRALPHLQQLLQGLHTLDRNQIHTSVGSLLGLGSGLTPSADDILLGLLYGLQSLVPKEAATAALRSAIETQAQALTNEISAAYLTAVAQAEPFQRLDDLLDGLGKEDTIDIGPILEIGSSSGSEMLLGLLLAANITLKG